MEQIEISADDVGEVGEAVLVAIDQSPIVERALSEIAMDYVVAPTDDAGDDQRAAAELDAVEEALLRAALAYASRRVGATRGGRGASRGARGAARPRSVRVTLGPEAEAPPS